MSHEQVKNYPSREQFINRTKGPSIKSVLTIKYIFMFGSSFIFTVDKVFQRAALSQQKQEPTDFSIMLLKKLNILSIVYARNLFGEIPEHPKIGNTSEEARN